VEEKAFLWGPETPTTGRDDAATGRASLGTGSGQADISNMSQTSFPTYQKAPARGPARGYIDGQDRQARHVFGRLLPVYGQGILIRWERCKRPFPARLPVLDMFAAFSRCSPFYMALPGVFLKDFCPPARISNNDNTSVAQLFVVFKTKRPLEVFQHALSFCRDF
jgi:hypothetical protein